MNPCAAWRNKPVHETDSSVWYSDRYLQATLGLARECKRHLSTSEADPLGPFGPPLSGASGHRNAFLLVRGTVRRRRSRSDC